MSIASRIEQIEQHLKDDYDVLGLAGAKGTELPIGYTQVDYIESSGTQYIDTGYTPNINTEVIMEFKDTNKSTWENYFGSENFRFLRRASDSTAFRWVCVTNVDMANLSIDNKRKLKFNKNGIYDENETLILSNPQTSLTSTKNMLLFLSWLGSSFDNFGIFIMYSFKIYDNGTLVRNFIPCYRNSDNEVGLYDLVNNVFYANQGTGAFTYGSVVLNRNIQNLKPQWLDRLVYFMNNGLDVVWENWEKVTGTGTYLTLNQTIQAPMKVVLNGNTTQYTTTGKNICDGINQGYWINQNAILGGKTTTDSGEVINVQGGSYTISTKATQTRYRVGLTNTLSTSNITISSGVNKDRTSDNITINTTGYSYLIINATDLTKIQVEQGSSATTFEEYTGGIASPNPDYPQEIEVVTGNNVVTICGKNVFNVAKLENSGWNYPNTNTRLSMFLDKVAQGTKMSVTNRDTTTYRYAVGFAKLGYASSSNAIVNESGWQTTSTYTVTASGEGYPFLQIARIDNGNISPSDVEGKFQYEYSDSATTYEAYTGQDYEVNLGKNLFNNTYNDLGMYNPSPGDSGVFAQGSQYLGAYLKVEEGETYSISRGKLTNRFVVGVTNEIPTTSTTCLSLKRDDSAYKLENVEIPSGYSYLVLYLSNNSETTDNLDLQIEKGSKATTYAPYFTPIQLCKIGDYKDYIMKSSGKNIFDEEFRQGSWNDTSTNNRVFSKNQLFLKAGTTFTFKTNLNLSTYKYGILVNDNPYPVNSLSASIDSGWLTTSTYTFTTTRDGYFGLNIAKANGTDSLTPSDIVSFNSQLEISPTATQYEPYGYDWYKHSEIGKVVFDGSETIDSFGNSTYEFRVVTNLSNVADGTSNVYCLCDKMIGKTGNAMWNYRNTAGYNLISSGPLSSNFLIILNNITTSSGISSALSTLKPVVYYVLTTPTNTKITNENLISQLEALSNAKSCNSQTNISQSNSNLPFILDVSALKQL